jgi:hypothetical protein
VFCLCGTHWVSIRPSFYTDDAYCWCVTNFEIACEALAKLLASQYFTNSLCLVLGVNVIFVIGFLFGNDLNQPPFMIEMKLIKIMFFHCFINSFSF